MDDTVRVEEIRPARERAAEAPICLAGIIWLARVVFRHSVTPSRRRPEAQLCSPSLGSLGNGSVTLVPMALSTLAFVGAIWRGVSAEVFFAATDRALFLSTPARRGYFIDLLSGMMPTVSFSSGFFL